MALTAKTLALGLLLSPGTPDAPGMEVARPEYMRIVVAFQPTPDGALTNAAAIEWPRANSLWGDVGWLATWTLDGAYDGYGTVVADDGLTPTVVRIDQGEVARLNVGAIRLVSRYVPSLYGAGLYGAGLYSHGPRLLPPRPYGMRGYGAGPYSRALHSYLITGQLSLAMTAEAPCCPNAANWVIEALP